MASATSVIWTIGAVMRLATASPALSRHRGPALVFDSYAEMLARIDAPDLPVTPEHVLVLRNAGAVGVPGLPEWGALPIPRKLLLQGVTDMVRLSDARMSGTAGGTNVLHIAPEAAIGGPLALVCDGDMISLDVGRRGVIELHLAGGRPGGGRTRIIRTASDGLQADQGRQQQRARGERHEPIVGPGRGPGPWRVLGKALACLGGRKSARFRSDF